MEAGDRDRVLEALSLSSGLSGGGSGGEEPNRKGKGEVRERDMDGRRSCAKGEGVRRLSFRER